jgi:hypothetical protein
MNEFESEVAKEIAKEVAKQIPVKEVYEDAVKPILKPTVDLLSLIPQTINAVLAPLQKWILYSKYSVEELNQLLAQKLCNVPPEMIEPPEPYIAVPALQSISYSMDNEYIRNMYANLLASSMTAIMKANVHPSYLEIIKQLSPDEAKILAYLYRNRFEPIIGFYIDNRNFLKNEHEGIIFSLITEKANCDITDKVEEYFQNLERLKLVEDAYEDSINMPNSHDELINHPIFTEKISKLSQYDVIKGFSVLTKFGHSFCNICLNDIR